MITEKPIHAITPTSSQDDTLLNLKGNKMTKIIVKNFQHQIKFLENIAEEGMEEDRWVEKLTSYAEIKPLCDSKFLALENISFGHIITEGYFLFRIRFIKNITTKMRILFKEREFEIKRNY
ncbi:hypothetical protein RAS_05490 [Rickettsia asiatica]|uniref:Uncharacterized protein n=2 Tax=Rickettsia asiatica TaxID=238800 RepID=A0A510G727_9RICK|nr:hypothetical protein RAS_05490 [Rickettsia asiatica]